MSHGSDLLAIEHLAETADEPFSAVDVSHVNPFLAVSESTTFHLSYHRIRILRQRFETIETITEIEDPFKFLPFLLSPNDSWPPTVVVGHPLSERHCGGSEGVGTKAGQLQVAEIRTVVLSWCQSIVTHIVPHRSMKM
jgi:hypothetical protein